MQTMKKVKIINPKVPTSPNIEQVSLSLTNRTTTSKNKSDKEELEFNDFLKAIKSKNKKLLQSFIIKYFETLTQFIDLISQLFHDYKMLLGPLIDNMEYERIKKNTILFRIDDIGDKFYIILKGKVSILTVTQKQYFLTKGEYLKHLIKLKLYDEKLLLKKTIDNPNNFKLYNLSEIDFSLIKPYNISADARFSFKHSSSTVFDSADKEKKEKNIFNKEIYDQISASVKLSTEMKTLHLSNNTLDKTKFFDYEKYDEVNKACKEYNLLNVDYLERLNVDFSNIENSKKEELSGVSLNTILEKKSDTNTNIRNSN